MHRSTFAGAMFLAAAGLTSSLALLAACGDDTSNGADDRKDATSGSPDGQSPPSQAEDAGRDTDADATVEAGTGCNVGETSSAIVGDGGVTVALCGATLEVPAGALAVGTTVKIETVAPPGPAWFDFKLSGPVFRFLPDDRVLDLPAKVTLTRDVTMQRGPVLTRWVAGDGLWAEHEACPENERLSIKTSELGTFGLMQDSETYPADVADLGSASISLNLGGAQTEWTVPGAGGYAVYEPSQDARFLRVVARRSDNGHLQNLDLLISVPKTQPASLLQVSWISTDPDAGIGYSYVGPVHGPPTSFTLTEPNAGSFEGTLSVVGHAGDETVQIDATFATTPVKYRPPPSYACELPEGDRR